MLALAARPGFTAGTLGTILLLLLLGVRLVFKADSGSVHIFNRNLSIECGIRHQFGIPCPACGLTRSVIMTLAGNIQPATRLNPAGPFAIFGVFAFSISMFYLSYRQQSTTRRRVEQVQRGMLVAVLAYGALVVLVMLGHWVVALMIFRQ